VIPTATPLNVDDLIVHWSDQAGVGTLSVTIHDFPADAPLTFFPERDAYSFWYRPRIEKGDTRVTVSELGLSHHRIYRDHVLVFPPFLPVQGEWERAEGRVARFSFSQRFFGAIADQVGLPLPGVNDFWHAFFAIDQQLEALCRLLMEETESQCPHGRLYFEPLAQALAVAVLSTVRDEHLRKTRAAAVPPGIRRAIQCLESDFSNDFSIAELAALAQLSRSHFEQAFRHITGSSPHQYLLRVRLSYARKLMGQGNQALSLAQIAAASGFFDQSHLNRVFRRFFGTTPSHFRSQQEALANKSPAATSI
jgi:AraC-like DNA-binding protein